jgi:adenylyltransferase/sulfurtransferase
MRFSEYTLERDPSCPACGTKKTEIIQGQSPQGIGERSFYAPSISCQEYHQRYRATGRPHVLLDVRNPPEASIAAIEDSRLIPLDELPKRWRELPRDLEIIVYCKSGVRSARAAAILLQAGVSAGVASLEGGILAWIDLFAPELSRY